MMIRKRENEDRLVTPFPSSSFLTLQTNGEENLDESMPSISIGNLSISGASILCHNSIHKLILGKEGSGSDRNECGVGKGCVQHMIRK